MITFIHGAVAMGCALAGVFFFRFWRQSMDRLFLRFAWAFWILAVSYGLLGLIVYATEWRLYVFILRLAAFCMILYGIAGKNRRTP